MTTIVGTATWLRSVHQWAKITGISRSELYRRIESGVLRTRLVNRVIGIHHGDMQKMLDGLPTVCE